MFCQQVFTSTSPAWILNTNQTDFSLSKSTQNVLQRIFEMKENLTVPSSLSEVPKNAVLLDSYLHKTTCLLIPASSACKAKLGKVAAEQVPTIPLHTMRPTRGAKSGSGSGSGSGPTGRPNFFYLGQNAEMDGWWSNLDVAPDAKPLEDTVSVKPQNSSTTMSKTTSSQSEDPFSSSSSPFPLPSKVEAEPVPQPTQKPFIKPFSAVAAANTTKHFSYEDASRPDVAYNPRFMEGHEPEAGRARTKTNMAWAAATPDGKRPSETRNGISPPFGAYKPEPLDTDTDTDMGPPSRSKPAAPNGDEGIKLETCSIGDDSTCSADGYEVCRKDDGVSSCMCRPGTARKRLRAPCQGTWSYYLYVRMNRFYDRQLAYGPHLADKSSYAFTSLARQVMQGIWSIVEKSDLRDSMVDCAVNWFGPFSEGILANITVTFVKTADGDPSTLPTHLQEILLDSLRRSERRLGESHLFVGNLLNAVPGVQDINECISGDLNDCNASAVCSNMPGSYMCTCKPGYADRHGSDPLRSGRTCEACEEAFCSQRGVCLMGPSGKTCQCNGWHLGVNCQTDGQVVAVACGSCALAVILIAIALIFLLRWSRHNNSSGDPSSTLARSEVSAHTFTYVKNHSTSNGLLALKSQGSSPSETTMDNKLRAAYLVHPSLLAQLPVDDDNQRPMCGHVSTDANFYEMCPPPTMTKLASQARPTMSHRDPRSLMPTRWSDQLQSDVSSLSTDSNS